MSSTITELTSVDFNEADLNAGPELIDSAATFTTTRTDFSTSALVVSGLAAGDSVAVLSGGGVSISGSATYHYIAYNGSNIGSYTGGVNGSQLLITFNSSANAAGVQAVIDQLGYSTISNSPPGSHNLNIAFNPTLVAAPDAPVFDVGTRATVATGRLTGDSRVDLVVGGADGTVTIKANVGTATDPSFTTIGTINTGLVNAHVAVGDVNGDGKGDIVVGDQDGHLAYYKGDGNGDFTPLTGASNPFNSISFGSSSNPAPTLGDFDNDGDVDLLVGTNYALHYYRNDGGVFTDQTTGSEFTNKGSQQGAPTFADVDGDGHLDLVVSNNYGSIAYYRNVDGTLVYQSGAADPFSSQSSFGYSQYKSVAIADLNGDGKADLISGKADGTVTTYLADAEANANVTVNIAQSNDAPTLHGLAASVTFAENAANAAGQLIDTTIQAVDPESNFNGGTLKVTGLLAEDSVSVHDTGVGAGQVGFDSHTGAVSYGGVVVGAATGGHDGADFTVTFNAAASGAAVQAVTEDLAFADSSDNPTASRTLHVHLTDADGATNAATAQFHSFVQNSSTFYNTNNTLDGVDIDHDGDQDLIRSDGYSVVLVSNIGTAAQPNFDTNHAQTIFAGQYNMAVYDAVVGDIDGDGKLDVLANQGASTFYGSTNSPGGILDLEQTGATWTQQTNSSLSSLSLAAHLALADLDQDGDLDLVASASDNHVHYYINDGAGNFTEQTGNANPFSAITTSPSGLPASGNAGAAMAMSDVDGDGDLDMVIDNPSVGLQYYLNTGTAQAANFVLAGNESNPFYPLTDKGGDLGFADLNGDGVADLMQTAANVGLFVATADPFQAGDITVGVTAQNDGPVFASGGVQTVTLVEDGVDEAAVTSTGGSAVVFVDPDNGDAAPTFDTTGWTQVGSSSSYTEVGKYGVATLDTATGVVSYMLDDEDVDTQGLKSGQTAVDTFTIKATDVHGAEGSHTVSFNIEGDNDPVTGTSRADSMVGSQYVDVLAGLGGNDTLVGGDGADSLDGGSQNDTLVGGLGNDTLDGGSGVNTASYAGASSAVAVNLTAGLAVGQGADVLFGITSVIGSNYADQVIGSTLADSLAGSGGNDTLDGGAGVDTLDGGVQSDVLNGGTGADSMIGGLGNDTYVVDNVGDKVVEAAGSGNDTVQASITYTLGDSVEMLVLTGTQAINGTGNDGDNVIKGNDKSNVLEGGGGDDQLVGGAGWDIASYQHATGAVSVSLALDGPQQTGAAGMDSLTSMEGLTGSGYDDTLTGNGRSNDLSGGGGADTLIGGGGADNLTGGAGIDTFTFTAVTDSAGRVTDLITDLTNADRIDLSGIDAISTTPGDDPFHQVAAFTRHAGELVVSYNSTTGQTSISGDVDGNGKADFTIFAAGDHHDFTNFAL